jgi:hypothetical protein
MMYFGFLKFVRESTNYLLFPLPQAGKEILMEWEAGDGSAFAKARSKKRK